MKLDMQFFIIENLNNESDQSRFDLRFWCTTSVSPDLISISTTGKYSLEK